MAIDPTDHCRGRRFHENPPQHNIADGTPHHPEATDAAIAAWAQVDGGEILVRLADPAVRRDLGTLLDDEDARLRGSEATLTAQLHAPDTKGSFERSTRAALMALGAEHAFVAELAACLRHFDEPVVAHDVEATLAAAQHQDLQGLRLNLRAAQWEAAEHYRKLAAARHMLAGPRGLHVHVMLDRWHARNERKRERDMFWGAATRLERAALERRASREYDTASTLWSGADRIDRGRTLPQVACALAQVHLLQRIWNAYHSPDGPYASVRPVRMFFEVSGQEVLAELVNRVQAREAFLHACPEAAALAQRVDALPHTAGWRDDAERAALDSVRDLIARLRAGLDLVDRSLQGCLDLTASGAEDSADAASIFDAAFEGFDLEVRAAQRAASLAVHLLAAAGAGEKPDLQALDTAIRELAEQLTRRHRLLDSENVQQVRDLTARLAGYMPFFAGRETRDAEARTLENILGPDAVNRLLL